MIEKDSRLEQGWHHVEWQKCFRLIKAGDPTSFAAEPRCLFVGEDNPQSADAARALWPSPASAAGKRLQHDVLGLPPLDYMTKLWRTNLVLPTPSDRKDARGLFSSRWNRDVARERAAILFAPQLPWRVIVGLGRKVTECFEYAIKRTWRISVEINLYDWIPLWWEHSGADVHFAFASLPHPSGLNREWNEPANIDRARVLLTELAPEVPWGSLGRIPVPEE